MRRTPFRNWVIHYLPTVDTFQEGGFGAWAGWWGFFFGNPFLAGWRKGEKGWEFEADESEFFLAFDTVRFFFSRRQTQHKIPKSSVVKKKKNSFSSMGFFSPFFCLAWGGGSQSLRSWGPGYQAAGDSYVELLSGVIFFFLGRGKGGGCGFVRMEEEEKKNHLHQGWRKISKPPFPQLQFRVQNISAINFRPKAR